MVHGVNLEILGGVWGEGVRLSHGRNIRKGALVRSIVSLEGGVLKGEEDGGISKIYS
jgi:hypothetical protein